MTESETSSAGEPGEKPDDPATEKPVSAETESVVDTLLDETGRTLNWRSAILLPILAMFSALTIGAIIIAFADVDRFALWFSEPGAAFSESYETVRDAYKALFLGAFGGSRPISETLTRASPLILAGLAVAAGFQAGLFNIGAKGQMLVGGMFATYVGFTYDFSTWVMVPMMVFAGLIGGGLYGAIPGWLRGKTGAHEVITTIMLNFIALRLVDWLLTEQPFQKEGRNDPVSKSINESAEYPRLITLPGFNQLESSVENPNRLRVHLGIFLALAAAGLLWWILNKSTKGFEFRTVGANPDAARYAGMNVTRVYVAVMALSGALAGLAGADQIAGPLGRATPNFAADIGFDAIAISLLGRSHPVGVVLSGLLFAALAAGGQNMEQNSNVGIDLVQIIQALIIVFIAAPALIRAVFRVKAQGDVGNVTQGWST